MNKVMYSIYHIPNVKIGCSTNPHSRVKKQGYSDFEILEEHTCIDTVSKRELELQKEYGYKVDKSTYKLSAQKFIKLKGKLSKPVLQYSIKKTKESLFSNKFIPKIDKLVNEYPSYAEAKRKTKISHLSCVCNGKRKHAGGFIWKWKD